MLTRDQITVGVTLRVIRDRIDRPAGTFARVTATGIFDIEGDWWFTVEWLTVVPKQSKDSLRLGLKDLTAFELVTGPVEIPPIPY